MLYGLRMPRYALKMADQLEHNPTIWAGAWFGFWGLVASSAIYLEPAIARGSTEVALYLFLPAASAAAAGARLGARILHESEDRGAMAVGVGVRIAVEAYAIFGCLFSAAYLIANRTGSTSPAGLLMAVLSVGFLATAPITIPIGGLAGWGLHLIGRFVARRKR